MADAGLTLAQRWYSARIGEGLIYDLRTKVFSHVQRMPLAFFSRTHTGALVSRLNSDVIGAQSAFTSTLSNVVSNVLAVILVGFTMLYLSWQITLLALVILPVFYFPAKWAGRRLSGLTREQMQTNATMASMATERFQVGGALLVTLFGRHADEDREYAQRSAKVRDLGVEIAMTGRIFFSALTLVAALATALVYGVGGNLVISGSLSLGTLLALATLMGRLYGPLTSLSNVRVDIMTALVSFERVFEVLDLEPMIQEQPDAVDLTGHQAAGRVRPRVVPLPVGRRGVPGQPRGADGERHGAEPGGHPRRQLHPGARRHGCAGRAVRRRQDHAHPPGGAVVRRHRRGRSRRRCGRA